MQKSVQPSNLMEKNVWTLPPLRLLSRISQRYRVPRVHRKVWTIRERTTTAAASTTTTTQRTKSSKQKFSCWFFCVSEKFSSSSFSSSFSPLLSRVSFNVALLYYYLNKQYRVFPATSPTSRAQMKLIIFKRQFMNLFARVIAIRTTFPAQFARKLVRSFGANLGRKQNSAPTERMGHRWAFSVRLMGGSISVQAGN